MSEVKIVRFVDIYACESIFSENSTFVLRSPEHYRRLYETTNGKKGDRNEGRAYTANGGTHEFTGFVISCWTKLKKTEPTPDEWNIFKENKQNIVAIVTPIKVCEFLNKKLETEKVRTKRRLPFWPVEHKEVDYDPPKEVDRNNIIDVVPFTKDKKFINEEEYRFVLKYARYPCLIDSFIFCGGIDYMEPSFVNPKIEEKDKNTLRLILMKAMAGYGDFTGKKMEDIIANVGVLF